MNNIPWHQLYDRAESGVEIDHFKEGDTDNEDEPLGAHRDDHYIFFMVEGGKASLMIDFNTIALVPGMIYFILPGQVHYRINAENAYGWYLAIDTGLLGAAQRQVFEERLTLQKPITLNTEQQERYQQLLTPLYSHYLENEGNPFYRQILYNLVQAFTGMVAAQYRSAEELGNKANRKNQLSRAFKTLLTEKVISIKSPSEYAALLNVSASYLNEALKETTGLNVSYWITQEIVLEAKRLLYYTESNVKQIAHQLGYEDHTYFSRIFKQHVGITPLEFRKNYRK